MAFFDETRKNDFLSISGTKMRKMARTGEKPPNGFMVADGWRVLEEFYKGTLDLEAELSSDSPKNHKVKDTLADKSEL